MKNGKRTLTAVLYLVIGVALLGLFVPGISALPVCAASAGFLLAGALLWDGGFYIAAGCAAVVIYLRCGSIPITVVAALSVVAAVIAMKACIKRAKTLSSTVSAGALCACAAILAAGAAVLYIRQGNFNTYTLLAPLHAFSKQLDAEIVAMAGSLPQAGQMTQEQLSQYIYDSLTYKEELFESIILVLPALVGVCVTVGCFISFGIARLLAGKKYAELIPTERLSQLRLSRASGGSYIACWVLALLADGTFGIVITNYVFLLELPFIAEGVIVVYRFLTRRTQTTARKVIAVAFILLTLSGSLVSLAWIYALLGALDTYVDFRARMQGKPAPPPEE